MCPIDAADAYHATPVGLYAVVLSIVLLLGAVAPAAGQDVAPAYQAELASEGAPIEDALLLGDLVVTAQKREQSIQDVPVAITALDAEQLARRQGARPA